MKKALVLLGLMGALANGARAQQVAPPALEVLLESRAALALTTEQVTRIEAIRASLAQRNEPLIARMMEYRAQYQRETRAAARANGGRRQGQAIRQVPPMLGSQAQPSGNPRIEQIRQAAQALLEQIQANNKAVMQQEVNQLLTPPQRRRLRELVEQRKPAAQVRPGAPGARAGAARPPGGLEG